MTGRSTPRRGVINVPPHTGRLGRHSRRLPTASAPRRLRDAYRHPFPLPRRRRRIWACDGRLPPTRQQNSVEVASPGPRPPAAEHVVDDVGAQDGVVAIGVQVRCGIWTPVARFSCEWSGPTRPAARGSYRPGRRSAKRCSAIRPAPSLQSNSPAAASVGCRSHTSATRPLIATASEWSRLREPGTVRRGPEEINDQRRLLAAIAAGLLGSQGSPVWSRTAELLLLSSRETRWHYQRAVLELKDLLGEDTLGR